MQLRMVASIAFKKNYSGEKKSKDIAALAN